MGAIAANLLRAKALFAEDQFIRAARLVGARDAAMQAQLGEEAFYAAYAEGRTMTLERAVAYVLGDDD